MRTVMKDLTDPAFINQLFRKCHCRNTAIVEPHQTWMATDRPTHLPSFGSGHRKRLLAQNDFSSIGGRKGNGCVQRIRSGNVDNIYVSAGHNRTPIGRSFFPSPLRRERVELRRCAATDDLRFHLVRNVEKVSYLLEGVRMRPGDEATADQGDVQSLFALWHGSGLDYDRTPRESKSRCNWAESFTSTVANPSCAAAAMFTGRSSMKQQFSAG